MLTSALVFGGVVAAVPAVGADLTAVPKTEYRLHAVSSESAAYPAPPALDGTALGAFDGDYGTQWVSDYANKAPFPHWIAIDLQRAVSIKALDYSGKRGQRIDAKSVEVYVTDDAATAKGSPADGGWGAPVAAGQLEAPTSDAQKQRIALDEAVTGRFVALVIIEAQDMNGNGGGAGEIEVLSDQVIPPITEPEQPTTPEIPADEVHRISAGGTTASVDRTFPRIRGYEVGDASFAGQRTGGDAWAVNGTTYPAETVATASATKVDYVSTLSGVDVTVHSTVRVADDGTVHFEVTKITGGDVVNTLALPGNTFLSAGAGATLDRTIASPDSTTNADEHISITASSATGAKGAAYAFLGDGALIGSIITNATTQASGSSASWNTRLTTRITDTDGRSAEIGSNAWLVHPTSAADDRVATYELPRVTVMFSGDRNGDEAVDWQDAGIRYREVDAPRKGAERVAERVVSRIPFNFASSATNYFDLVLDNTKRIANQTDGLGQWVLNKGYGSEGHDSANTDYGGNYNERAGGLSDLNHLIGEGAALNADMSVHVNATEIYPQANSFDSAILQGAAPYSPGWNWLDQSFYIDQQVDLGTGRVLDRFEELAAEAPGLSGVYVDVYYSNGWVAEELANKLNDLDLEVATEWGDKFVDSSVWAHWPNDLAYGGKTNKGINSTMVRFIQNGQADIWNDDALLGQQRLVDAEGWSGNSNWDGFIDNVWTQSLPTKFIQQFDLLSYAAGSAATLTDDVQITIDGGTRVITMDGATVLRGDSYLLPWQTLASNDEAGSPVDADKMYFFSASGGKKTFGLTGAFSGNSAFDVFQLTDQGREKVSTVNAVDGTLTVTGEAGVAYAVVPQGGAERAAVAYHDAGLDDPGFNSGSLDAWHPSGDVTLARTSHGDGKADPTGDNVAVLGAGESSISQTVTGLTPGERYTFSAQVQIDHDALRDVTVSVDAGAGAVTRTWNLSPTYNYMRADSKSGLHYQRGAVSFLAPASGEVEVAVSAADGESTVRVDNARVMRDTTAPHATGTVYSNDFEGNQPGWGPFVKGDANGIDDPRTSISHKQDPYTSAEWRNTAKPHDPQGSEPGRAVDSVLSGGSSLMSHSENTGVVYRTDPTLVALQPGHTYDISFDYQVGADGAYRWLAGTDTVAGGELSSAVLSGTPIAQALQTERFTQTVAVGCGDYTWVGLERLAGPAVDFILDDVTVTDRGETPGGTPCAAVTADGAVLSPGTQASFTTTFTNSEDVEAQNVGVQLDLPEGYEVQVAEGSSNVFDEVAVGESVQTVWLITAPAADAGKTIPVGVAATYRADCDVRTVSAELSASVAQRARIPHTQIGVTASSEETAGEDGRAVNVLDGDRSTIWHSRWSSDQASYPHSLTFDLGAPAQVDGISYVRRAANTNGPIKAYTVEVSADGTTYTKVAEGEWKNVAEQQDVSFEGAQARYVRVTALSSISGTPFAAVAEMGIYGVGTAQEGHAPADRAEDDLDGCTPPAVDPALVLGAKSVAAGSTVEADLTGFAPDSAVTFWLDDQRLAQAAVDAEGALSTNLLIPADAAPGARQVLVKGQNGETLASAELKVRKAPPASKPTVTPAVDSVRAGASLDVQLRGFESGADVQLWLHSEPVRIGEVRTGDDGTAVATVIVPVTTAAGQHALVATDSAGEEIARADLTVTPALGADGSDGVSGTLPMTGLDGILASSIALGALALMALGGVLLVRRRRAA